MRSSVESRNSTLDEPLLRSDALNRPSHQFEVLDIDEDGDIFLDDPHSSPAHPTIESWNNPKSNILKVIAVFYGMGIFGMNDSSLGVLVQSLEAHYHISYQTVSYSFLVAFSGYLIAAFICDHLHRYLGRWGVSVMGIAAQLLCYVIAACAPPFPMFVFAYGVSGFGNGLLEAAWNSWAGNLKNQNEILGLLHGFYGLGGMICPTVATAMISHGIRWNLFYLFMIGATAISLLLSAVAFRMDTPQAYMASLAIQHEQEDRLMEEDDDEFGDSSPAIEKPSHHSTASVIIETMKSPLTYLISFSLFCYVGTEVTLGGWITTFMIDVRHGNKHTMGYVATGFWTGITVGRMVLGFVAGKLFAGKEALLVLLYLIAAILLQMLFWFVPSIFVSALSAALIGVAIGPLYPSIMIVFLGKFPKHLHVLGVGVVASAGGVGGAVVPFVTGTLATAQGAGVLGPIGLIGFSAMVVSWVFVM